MVKKRIRDDLAESGGVDNYIAMAPRRPSRHRDEPSLPVLPRQTGIDMVRKEAPELLELYRTLLPFDDVIHTMSVGPPEGKASNENRCILIIVNDPAFPGRQTMFRLEKAAIYCAWLVDDERSPYVETSITQVFDYLRQLPRGIEAFAGQLA